MIVPADITAASGFRERGRLLNHTPIVLVPALYVAAPTRSRCARQAAATAIRRGQLSPASQHRAGARDLGVSVLKSDGISKDIDCPLDFGPYLLASQDRGMTRSSWTRSTLPAFRCRDLLLRELF